MRLLVAVASLTGCTQVFGLAQPDLAASDAARSPDGATVGDAPPADAMTGDAPSFTGCVASDATLVACFDFEGTTTDASMSSLAVTTSNVGYDPGVLGQALRSDDSTAVSIAETTDLDIAAVTIEAWIRLEQLPNAPDRAGVWDTDGQYGLFVIDTGAVRFLGLNSTPLTTSAGLITIDQWTHVAAVYDTTGAAIYVDGVLRASGAGGTLATSTANGSVVGGDAPLNDERLVGRIDQLRVYSVRRTPAQICAAAGC